jgi:hypothetical protein
MMAGSSSEGSLVIDSMLSSLEFLIIVKTGRPFKSCSSWQFSPSYVNSHVIGHQNRRFLGWLRWRMPILLFWCVVYKQDICNAIPKLTRVHSND